MDYGIFPHKHVYLLVYEENCVKQVQIKVIVKWEVKSTVHREIGSWHFLAFHNLQPYKI